MDRAQNCARLGLEVPYVSLRATERKPRLQSTLWLNFNTRIDRLASSLSPENFSIDVKGVRTNPL
jgi:hypothetical protein